ncbi:probable LRR receptor-like serine/threonine-protein kinase At1g67720 isoform X2 [Solanum dulcamara]|uniref:probable LRR receptor-like serine/threonine-protein kinase At1g67720 isoform X2 n=1 Tax=Solanum dulcamara TaxID=45834 RepID=UPI002485C1F6|nr:probable LRR receptor-like serine/threonine-protein kinase At1g67720 isoform X2 [Solanum dulcamara]
MGFLLQSFVILLCFTPAIVCQVTEFVSIDCGSANNYTDTSTGLVWTSDAGIMGHGKPVVVVNANVNSQQYQRRRDFPADSNKYCYTLNTKERRRYLVRATFLYGSPAAEGTYPKFQLYLDATKWGTITISESSRIYVSEMIIRAPSNSIDVCLCCATTESPFISTLELRPLNLSMYATDYEDNFYLKVAARVDFGAQSKEPIRYPDDPYDRIWDSDLKKRPNFLVDVAAGTERINTTKYIDTNTREYPPIKVMQTAVVGTKGMLSYRLNLDDFPANARAFAYFAEIEDLGMNETRKFKMEHPYVPDYSNAVVNIAENANGSYTLYEPSYMNITLDFILSFSFVKTPDSTRGPLLSAMEICRYVQIATKTDEQDVSTLNAFRSMSLGSDWTDEDGDPCVPTQWEWVTCSTTSPPRITKITMSGKNIKGEIPRELQHMEGLTELWLDGNSLTGTIPDLSNLVNLRIIDVQNNSLTGEIPSSLLTGKVTFKYEGNPNLRPESNHSTRSKVILGASIGGLVIILVLFAISIFFLCHFRTKVSHQKGESMRTSAKPPTACSIARGGSLMDEGVAYYIPLSVIEEATENFSTKIGKGSFGPVYYGRLRDGKEVAVKTMADSSSHGTKQFATEVALLSRIHHRNLVPLIGYYEDDQQRMLVYEYMHNGTLRDHITESTDKKHLDWLARLNIAEDAAKGLEYLHTGCNPSIIHRDVKTSNILLDINMRAKVSDFGLSRQAEEDLTHVSSVARGTVGYLDPEYYANQQLTEKSDVYSFGVVLLELISGRKPFSTEEYGAEWSIVHWARSLIRKGDVISIMDPALVGHVKVESVWRIAEVAIQCVERHGTSRPRMHEILSAIQDAIKIEKGIDKLSSSGSSKAQSSRKTLLTSFLDVESPDVSRNSLTPSAR